MNITAADVAKLRKITGAGMMDCKKALSETNGDFDLAIDYLRKKGQKVSAKRADREATEGVVVAKTEGGKGIIVEINCETDFVAKNEEFIGFVNEVADCALANFPETKEELMGLNAKSGQVVDLINNQMGKIGEKIELSTYKRLEGEMVVPYIHLGNKIGVLVSLNKHDDSFVQIGKDVAMQIAAMSPIALDKTKVEQSVIDHEIEIAKEQIKAEGKPEHIAEKIAQGKLNKFFKDNTLMEQAFVKDSSMTVKDAVKKANNDLDVTDYVRVAIGS